MTIQSLYSCMLYAVRDDPITVQLRNNKASKIHNQLFTVNVWTLGIIQ